MGIFYKVGTLLLSSLTKEIQVTIPGPSKMNEPIDGKLLRIFAAVVVSSLDSSLSSDLVFRSLCPKLPYGHSSYKLFLLRSQLNFEDLKEKRRRCLARNRAELGDRYSIQYRLENTLLGVEESIYMGKRKGRNSEESKQEALCQVRRSRLLHPFYLTLKKLIHRQRFDVIKLFVDIHLLFHLPIPVSFFFSTSLPSSLSFFISLVETDDSYNRYGKKVPRTTYWSATYETSKAAMSAGFQPASDVLRASAFFNL